MKISNIIEKYYRGYLIFLCTVTSCTLYTVALVKGTFTKDMYVTVMTKRESIYKRFCLILLTANETK